MSLHYVVLLLGSNLGNKNENLQNAIAKIENKIGKIKKSTKIEETLPLEFASKNIFCNIALGLHTKHSPFNVLKALKLIENEMGRTQDSSFSEGYTDRIIDIDIVFYDNIIYESKKLEIPHKKHLFQRDFSKRLLKNLIKED
jgi:2-amino-4-hydroxy-6-hydroxymethyldihydropteridine diphosphokinase